MSDWIKSFSFHTYQVTIHKIENEYSADQRGQLKSVFDKNPNW